MKFSTSPICIVALVTCLIDNLLPHMFSIYKRGTAYEYDNMYSILQ